MLGLILLNYSIEISWYTCYSDFWPYIYIYIKLVAESIHRLSISFVQNMGSWGLQHWRYVLAWIFIFLTLDVSSTGQRFEEYYVWLVYLFGV
jgi:hypothetical protein